MMKAFPLYQQFRKRGCGSKEAATLTGYAFLIQQGDCAHLKISRHRAKEIKRAFRKLELRRDILIPSPHVSNGHKRDGVVLSGSI